MIYLNLLVSFLVWINILFDFNFFHPEFNSSDTDVRITTIKYTSRSGKGNYIRTFQYNKRKLLVRTDQVGNVYSVFDLYKYDNKNRLVDVSSYENDNTIEFTLRDSLTYNSNGQILNKFLFYTDSSGLLLHSIATYSYNPINQLIERRILSLDSSSVSDMNKYDWENGNIIRNEYYNSSGDLQSISVYTYDTHPNYRLHNPYYFAEPLYLGQNNMISTTIIFSKDSTQLGCYPCQNQYTYGKNGYPAKIHFESGSSAEILYEK